jgi:hypothetical protein
MSWKSILKDDRGLGDTVSRITKRIGIKECGGCKNRKAKLNKLVKYTDTTTWTVNLFTYHKHGYDEFNEEEDTFTGTFEEAKEWAVEKWDNYDISAEVYELYGGSGFYLEDERGKIWFTDKDV